MLEMRDLDEVEFQGTLEACGDSDPYGLVLDDEVIGFVLARYNAPVSRKLEELGIVVTRES